MKGFKTIGTIAAITLAVIAIPEVQALIVAHPAIAAVVNGVVVAALRFITTTPVFKAE